LYCTTGAFIVASTWNNPREIYLFKLKKKHTSDHCLIVLPTWAWATCNLACQWVWGGGISLYMMVLMKKFTLN